MGYRGEGYTGSGYDGRSDSYQDGYGRGDDDHEAGDYATGRYSTGSYVEGGYGTGPYSADGYSSGYEDSPGTHDSGAYHSAPFDDAYGGSSYDSASRDTGPFSTGPYRATPSGDSGSYSRPSYVSGGYPTLGHPSGGYPTQANYPNDTAGLPDPYADGNDWYGEQSGARQTGFSDTSTQIALRDPVRGYPPEPAGRGYTGPQRQYDENEYVTYPGYDGVEQDSPGYGARQGYDDYDDYAETRLDQPAVDVDHDGLEAYGPAWGSAPARRFGQALQSDDFDGGVYHDGGADVLSGPVPKKGAKRKRATDLGRGGPRPRRRSRALVLTVAGLVIIAAAGLGGYKMILAKHKTDNSAAAGTNESLPSTAPSAAMAQCEAQFGEFCHIETRVLDPAPLTLDEVYPPAFFNTSDKTNFTRVATKEDANCASAIYGTNLTSQLKAGACNQVLRASYISGDNQIMGTIGVINLSSTNQAHYAGKTIGGSNFIMPLATSTGPTSKLGKAKGWIQAQYRGHYLIVTWAQFANGAAPTTQALVQQLETFETDLIQGTVNSILSQRMVYGDTPATAPSATSSPSPSARISASSSPTATATS